jgi:hypothetical protein
MAILDILKSVAGGLPANPGPGLSLVEVRSAVADFRFVAGSAMTRAQGVVGSE